jgi:hypothetical protein
MGKYNYIKEIKKSLTRGHVKDIESTMGMQSYGGGKDTKE